MDRLTGRPPLVSWAQALALVLVAAIMAFLAWHTWQTVQVRGERLEPHRLGEPARPGPRVRARPARW